LKFSGTEGVHRGDEISNYMKAATLLLGINKLFEASKDCIHGEKFDQTYYLRRLSEIAFDKSGGGSS